MLKITKKEFIKLLSENKFYVIYAGDPALRQKLSNEGLLKMINEKFINNHLYKNADYRKLWVIKSNGLYTESLKYGKHSWLQFNKNEYYIKDNIILVNTTANNIFYILD